jgi:hypothetical protein
VQGAYSLTLKLDKHTHVTEVKAKNYSTDPSKSIILDAFSIEKSVSRLGTGGRWLIVNHLCTCVHHGVRGIIAP